MEEQVSQLFNYSLIYVEMWLLLGIRIASNGTVLRTMTLQDHILVTASQCILSPKVKSSRFCLLHSAREGIFHSLLLEQFFVGVDVVPVDSSSSASSRCCNKCSMRHGSRECKARLLPAKHQPSPSSKGRSRCVVPMIRHDTSQSSPEILVSENDVNACVR